MDQSKKPSFTYNLFLYRQELKRPKVQYKRLNKTKLSLTDELIVKGVRNMKKGNTEDLLAVSRQIVFKSKLQNQLQRLHKLERMGIKNVDPTTIPTDI